MAPAMLPPGFRFHPTDEELVAYYLDGKITGQPIELDIIPDVDLYKCEPWDLPDKSYLPSKDMEWYFFSPRDRKYPNCSRTNLATAAGYWKATGKDQPVKSQKQALGMKKTLVYYRGRAPHGIRTNWAMHEYRILESQSLLKDSYALCRIFKKTSCVKPKVEDHEPHESNENDQDYLLGMPPCDTSCSDAMEGGSSVDNGRVVHNINQAITMVKPCSSTEEEEAVSTNTSPTASRTDQILTNHKDEGAILPYPPLEMENFSLVGTYKETILTKPQIEELILIEEDKEYDPRGADNILEEVFILPSITLRNGSINDLDHLDSYYSCLNYPDEMDETPLH